LSEKTNIPILSQIEEIQDLGKKESQRKLGNIVMGVNGYNFFNCKCGVTIKVPPTLKSDTVKCPRCGEIKVQS
jgi:heat shock protein HtpX